jgi:hypothetical protein
MGRSRSRSRGKSSKKVSEHTPLLPNVEIPAEAEPEVHDDSQESTSKRATKNVGSWLAGHAVGIGIVTLLTTTVIVLCVFLGGMWSLLSSHTRKCTKSKQFK